MCNIPDLLHALDVVTELGVEAVGDGLTGLTVLAVSASVDEPFRDLKLLRLLDDGLDVLDLLIGQLTGAACRVCCDITAI